MPRPPVLPAIPTGWVRNMDDGSVTMEVQGTHEAVDVLWQEIWKGNGFIRVGSLETEKRESIFDAQGFDIRYSLLSYPHMVSRRTGWH